MSRLQGGTASRVVVAEDEALIRLDLVEMLGEAGYDVVGQASNGEQAVELALDLKPDLVIMDVKMPVMDGLSAADEIGKQRLCPVIMLTAFSQTELVERARDAGVMAYIVKPFTAADLTPAINIALSRWRELKELEQEVADLGEASETRKAVERAKGVLMKKLKLTEADAFRWIQKTAMDRRLGMKRGGRGRHRGHRQGLSTQAADQHFRHISHACLRICVVSGVTAIRPFRRRRRLL
jgi:AmiR/NasT family two-component response regulator